MAKLLGDVKDFEDYKQKIVRQRKLKKKTIESVKKYLGTDDIKLLETRHPSPQPSPSRGEGAKKYLPLQSMFNTRLNGVYKSFKNNLEKYEYLVANDPNNSWIAEFRNTKEYKLLYE